MADRTSLPANDVDHRGIHHWRLGVGAAIQRLVRTGSGPAVDRGVGDAVRARLSGAPIHVPEGSAASERAVVGAQRCGRHPGTRSPSSQCASSGEPTATGPRSSAYTSRTALLTKRRAVRSTNRLVYLFRVRVLSWHGTCRSALPRHITAMRLYSGCNVLAGQPGDHLGNFPQALTHAALVQAALALRAEGG
jgi:hypothetical protein